MIGELLQGIVRQVVQGELIRGTHSLRPSDKGETEQGSQPDAEVSTYLPICNNHVQRRSTVHSTAACTHLLANPVPDEVDNGSEQIPVEAHLSPAKSL